MELLCRMSTISISQLRRQFESCPDCRLVSLDVFIERLTCHEAWVRADEPDANLFGLLDQKTGNRIFVRMEEFAQRRFMAGSVN